MILPAGWPCTCVWRTKRQRISLKYPYSFCSRQLKLFLPGMIWLMSCLSMHHFGELPW
uniref:Uncharacterized protein n=1 Tax=Amazona collaria TaxID=241587 RepID=A0A8B9GM61_9PSIT